MIILLVCLNLTSVYASSPPIVRGYDENIDRLHIVRLFNISSGTCIVFHAYRPGSKQNVLSMELFQYCEDIDGYALVDRAYFKGKGGTLYNKYVRFKNLESGKYQLCFHFGRDESGEVIADKKWYISGLVYDGDKQK